MSEMKPNHLDQVISELAGRLSARRCRGLKVNLSGSDYPIPGKIGFQNSPEEGRIPDITTDVPAFIIKVEDCESMGDPKTLEYCKQLSAHARNNFKTFILAVPRSCMDRVKIRMGSSKIIHIQYIWY